MRDAPHVTMNPSAESLERMLEAARYGAQALDSATKRAEAEAAREAEKSAAEAVDTKPSIPPVRSLITFTTGDSHHLLTCL